MNPKLQAKNSMHFTRLCHYVFVIYTLLLCESGSRWPRAKSHEKKSFCHQILCPNLISFFSTKTTTTKVQLYSNMALKKKSCCYLEKKGRFSSIRTISVLIYLIPESKYSLLKWGRKGKAKKATVINLDVWWTEGETRKNPPYWHNLNTIHMVVTYTIWDKSGQVSLTFLFAEQLLSFLSKPR